MTKLTELELATRKENITQRLADHLQEGLDYFNKSQIVGIFLQGSQNYDLDLPGSDVDTKLIVVPSFKEIALNKKPVSTTHIRENEEHIDFKDVRLYMETFRKQNLNFLEILFTDFCWVNPLYQNQWNRLVRNREHIAHMNEFRAVKSMKGIALEKYDAMEHPYPSKVDILAKYGYDGKQVHHLLRVEDYLERYIDGEPYKKCLIPTESKKEHLLDYKKQLIPLDEARAEAEKTIAHVIEIADKFCDTHEEIESPEVRELLEDGSYNIMKIAVAQEIGQSNFITH